MGICRDSPTGRTTPPCGEFTADNRVPDPPPTVRTLAGVAEENGRLERKSAALGTRHV